MSFKTTMLNRLKRHFILLVLLCSVILLLSLWLIVHSHKTTWTKMISNVEVKKSLVKDITKQPNLTLTKPRQKNLPVNFWTSVNDSVTISKSIMDKRRPVLVTLINNAYLPFVYSWLCNTIYMNIHEQVLFITTDETSKNRLIQDWPRVNVVSLPVDNSLNGNQAYSKVGYVKLMVKRTEILNSLLMNNIEILLFEVDCLWISNPISDCKKHAISNDVIVTCIDRRPSSIAGGFIYMKPTPAMKKLWEKLTQKMRALGKEIQKKQFNKPVSESKNDQIFFMQLIQSRFAGIKYKVLPWDYYPDGKWYSMKKNKRDKIKPVIINNNWVIGNTKKLQRAKKWGHWFVDNNLKCIMKDVDKVVNKGIYNII